MLLNKEILEESVKKSFLFLVVLAGISAGLTVTSPADDYVNNTAATTFTFTPALNASNCTVFANDTGAFLQKASLNSSNETANRITATLSEGRSSWHVFCEASTNETSSNYTITIDLTPPTQPVMANQTNASSNNVSYTATDALSGLSYYEFYKNNSLAYNGTSTSYADYTLNIGYSYHYKAKAFDNAGNYAEQTLNLTFNPQLSMATPTATAYYSNATVAWTTSVATNRTLKYGTNSSMLNTTNTSATAANSHSATLTLLAHTTTYYYNVTACNTVCVEQGPYSFTTLLPSPPEYSNITRTGYKAGSTITVSVYWTIGLGAPALGYYTFSTDNNGTWSNSTPVSFGSGTSGYSNATFTLNSSTSKISTQWLFYANDSNGKLTVIPNQTIVPLFPEASTTPTPAAKATPTPSPTPTPAVTTPTTTPNVTTTTIPTSLSTPTKTPVKANTSSTINSFTIGKSEGVVQDRFGFTVDPETASSVTFNVNFSNQGEDGTYFLELTATNGKETANASSQAVNLKKGGAFNFAASLALPKGKVTVDARIKKGNETVTKSTLQVTVAPPQNEFEFDFNWLYLIAGTAVALAIGFFAFQKLGKKTQGQAAQRKEKIQKKQKLEIKWKEETASEGQEK